MLITYCQRWDVLCECQSNRVLNKVKIGHGSQSRHELDLFHITGPLTSHYEERGSALRVSNIVDLLETLTPGKDIINGSRQIVYTQFVERKVPKLRLISMESLVLPGIAISTGVEQPNIIAKITEQIRQGPFRTQNHICCGTVEKPMNHQDRLSPLPWNTMGCQHKAIFGQDLVCLRRIIIFFY